MATSGTAIWNLEVDEIIDEALEMVGGEHVSGNEAKSTRRSLNLMFRDLENRGYPLARLEAFSQTLTEDTRDYTLDADIMDVMDLTLLRDSTDLEMTRITLFNYQALPRKSQSGRPTTFTTDRDRDAITLSVWPTPENSTDIVNGWVVKRIEDVNRSAQNVDLNVRFLPAMCVGLAYYMSFKRTGIEPTKRQELKLEYEELLERALEEDRERTSLFALPTLNIR